MARRSLKPQLNQIRAWVRQGRTDAWIAHQLEVSTSELREFRKQHGFTPDEEDSGAGEARSPRRDRGRDRGRHRRGGRGRGGRGARVRRARTRTRRRQASGDGERPKRRRRRGRRGGRGRRKELEATFDHGETDGYGLWLDPSVKDNPVYAEHWAGKREVTVRIDADQIVIRRAGGSEPEPESDDSATRAPEPVPVGLRLTFSVETGGLTPQGIAEKVQDAPTYWDWLWGVSGIRRSGALARAAG